VRPGHHILFDDGTLEARVELVEKGMIRVTMLRGGQLKSKKGLNLPGLRVSADSVTKTDLEDLDWGITHGVDWVALSFVREACDLDPVRRRLEGEESAPMVIAKIETPEGVENAPAILAVADGIMVARGDLGVELSIEQVPTLQKRLIRVANTADKPVITATQMLESMITNARPTRAEVSDVANAVRDGTDAVMLSAETATGVDPVAAVDAMARIVTQAELTMLEAGGGYAANSREAATSGIHDALALGAERMARAIGAGAIVCATIGLETARHLAAARPAQPIIGMTPDIRSLGRLCLLWGVQPVWCPQFEDTSDALRHAKKLVAAQELVEPGGFLVLAVGRGPSREFSARVHLYQMPGLAVPPLKNLP
jgi:pyruvate kinase